MKAVPMIFNTEMVKALLDGRKTVTRRPVKRFGIFNWVVVNGETGIRWVTDKNNVHQKWLEFPTNVGDLIYVRETFCPDPDCDHDSWDNHELSYYEWDGCGCSAQFLPDALKNNKYCLYRAGSELDCRWVPSIHMPRWASRLTLKVTDVRIERVQDITDEQAIDEGISKHPSLPAWLSPAGYHTTPIYAYEELWNSLYSNWEENPYVWVIEFEVIHKNIDEVIENG